MAYAFLSYAASMNVEWFHERWTGWPMRAVAWSLLLGIAHHSIATTTTTSTTTTLVMNSTGMDPNSTSSDNVTEIPGEEFEDIICKTMDKTCKILIIGCVSCGVGLAALLVFAIIVCRRRSKKERKPNKVRTLPTKEQLDNREQVREQTYENMADISKLNISDISQHADNVLRYTPEPGRQLECDHLYNNQTVEPGRADVDPAESIPLNKMTTPDDELYLPPNVGCNNTSEPGDLYENVEHPVVNGDVENEDPEKDQVYENVNEKQEATPPLPKRKEEKTEDYENKEVIQKLARTTLASKKKDDAGQKQPLSDHIYMNAMEATTAQQKPSVKPKPSVHTKPSSKFLHQQVPAPVGKHGKDSDKGYYNVADESSQYYNPSNPY